MSGKIIKFKHKENSSLEYHFKATDDKFEIIIDGDSSIVNAFQFMDQIKWFIDSEDYKRVN